MKYAFLMPAYKGRYIKEAIGSILAQRYSDFALVVSDDCSPEGIQKIAESFHDSRIVYRRNTENIGAERLARHWNMLVELCRADYLILAPDDDIYSPDFLEEIDRLTQKYPHADVLKARARKVNDDGVVLAEDREYAEVITQIDNIFHQACHDHISGIGNYVFRTEALKSMDGFVDYPFAWWSDVMTNVLLSENGMPCTRDILFSMRMSGISISTRKSSFAEKRKKAEATMMFIDDIGELLKKLQPYAPKDAWRVDIVNKHLRQWLAYDLQNSAKAFTISETRRLMKKYPQIFSSKRFKMNFLKQVLSCSLCCH